MTTHQSTKNSGSTSAPNSTASPPAAKSTLVSRPNRNSNPSQNPSRKPAPASVAVRNSAATLVPTPSRAAPRSTTATRHGFTRRWPIQTSLGSKPQPFGISWTGRWMLTSRAGGPMSTRPISGSWKTRRSIWRPLGWQSRPTGGRLGSWLHRPTLYAIRRTHLHPERPSQPRRSHGIVMGA